MRYPHVILAILIFLATMATHAATLMRLVALDVALDGPHSIGQPVARARQSPKISAKALNARRYACNPTV